MDVCLCFEEIRDFFYFLIHVGSRTVSFEIQPATDKGGFTKEREKYRILFQKERDKAIQSKITAISKSFARNEKKILHSAVNFSKVLSHQGRKVPSICQNEHVTINGKENIKALMLNLI